jgi:hypothetical protein
MEAQQMMEVLLARMNASMKEHMQEMAARMGANRAEMKADRKADKEYMLAEMSTSMKSNQDLLARLEVKIDANRTKTDNTQERMDVNLKEMREEIKSGQAEMRSTLDVWLMDLKDGRKETTPATKRQRLSLIQELCSP